VTNSSASTVTDSYTRPLRVTWITGGHSYDEVAFDALIHGFDNIKSSLIKWPEAGELFSEAGIEELLASTDVLALYDLPGITFQRGSTPVFFEPTPEIIEGWQTIVRRGLPILAMHHAIASWPTWPFFAELVKGRFHYTPGELRGVAYCDSGYSMYKKQTFTVVALEHPICEGLPKEFSLTDETYLCPIFADEVTPLITTDASQDDSSYLSALAAVRREEQSGWNHPNGCALVAWTHTCENSSVVYLQPGDGPEAFANVVYRQLTKNAITWLASTKGGIDEQS
jgi:hypothetical protein